MSKGNFLDLMKPHIQFARYLFNQYDWSPTVRNELDIDFDKLQARIDNDCVNIAVIGEFSSGKSTVINAMLGMDLLIMDDLPDTTLIPSIIQFSETPTLEIVYNDGRTSEKEQMSIDLIRNYISQYSFRESLLQNRSYDEQYMRDMMKAREYIAFKASKIKQFNIGIPSLFLKNGFRIIDTPGLNSLNQDCTKVTQRVLATADSSIIVGMATEGGLHQDFRERLKDVLGVRIEQSIVVYTHFDKTSPDRRERTLTYLKGITASYFDLTPDKLPVLPIVAPTILAHLKGQKFGEEHDTMYQLTCESLDKVVSFSTEQREITIIKSLQYILERILSILHERIIDIKHTYEARLVELERSRGISFKPFIEKKVNHSINIISNKAKTYHMDLSNKLDSFIKELKCLLEKNILSKYDVEALQKYMKYGLPRALADASKQMDQYAIDESKLLYETITEELDSFDKALVEEFNRLNIVNINLNIKLAQLRVGDDNLMNSMKDAVKFTDSEFNRKDNAEVLATVGAIIGTIFTFGIGTIIGTIIGGLLGTRGRSLSVESIFKRLKPKYEKELDAALVVKKNKLVSSLDLMAEEYVKNFRTQLLGYQDRYKLEIKKMICEEEVRKKEINEKIKCIQNDLNEIINHQNEIKCLWKIN